MKINISKVQKFTIDIVWKRPSAPKMAKTAQINSYIEVEGRFRKDEIGNEDMIAITIVI